MDEKVVVKQAIESHLQAYVNIAMAIWGGKDREKIYQHFRKGFRIFNSGYSIAYTGQDAIGTGEGFPISEKRSIREMNKIEEATDLYDPNGDIYYIHGIEVLPEHRKKGIGRLLLEYNIDIARGLKCKQVCGIAISDHIDFWTKSGFQTEGSWQRYMNFGRFIWIYRLL